jgi:hypothetical protein
MSSYFLVLFKYVSRWMEVDLVVVGVLLLELEKDEIF